MNYFLCIGASVSDWQCFYASPDPIFSFDAVWNTKSVRGVIGIKCAGRIRISLANHLFRVIFDKILTILKVLVYAKKKS